MLVVSFKPRVTSLSVLQWVVKSLRTLHITRPHRKSRHDVSMIFFSSQHNSKMESERSFGTEISANRRRNCEFTPVQKAVMVEKLSSGKSHRNVAAEFNTTPSTTHAIFKRWRVDKTLEKKPRSGRPHILSRSEKRYILIMIKRNRKISYKALIGAMHGAVSRSTIRRVIQQYYRRKWRSLERIPLSEETAKKRLDFARYWKENVQELMQVQPIKIPVLFSNIYTNRLTLGDL